MVVPYSAEHILSTGVEQGCSDIHIKPGSPPKFRIRGQLVNMEGAPVLTAEETQLLSYQIMDEKTQAQQVQSLDQFDFALDMPDVGRFRVNLFKTRSAYAFVARLLQDTPQTLDELGVPAVVKELSLLNNGIIIVTGATGSGKSSTLAGIIDHINKSRDLNIISIENPIEILHSDLCSSIAQREIGADVETFDLALQASLRQDPDVIVVGEARDVDTMRTVLLAADTGHLVVTTLHTTDSVETINRIVNMYPLEEREETRRILSSTLKGVISQRLAPTLDGGRTAVNEIMLNTPEISDMISNPSTKSRDMKKVIAEHVSEGMQTFEQSLEALVKTGKISVEVAKTKSDNPKYFEGMKTSAVSTPTQPRHPNPPPPDQRPRTGSHLNPPVTPQRKPQTDTVFNLPRKRTNR